MSLFTHCKALVTHYRKPIYPLKNISPMNLFTHCKTLFPHYHEAEHMQMGDSGNVRGGGGF